MIMVLVDSSVWIDYFRGSGNIDTVKFEDLIDSNSICTNNLILAELIPSLLVKHQSEVVEILRAVRNIPVEIDWNQIIHFQHLNYLNGVNKAGIPDLIILQNVIVNDLVLYSLDAHFKRMGNFHKFRSYN